MVVKEVALECGPAGGLAVLALLHLRRVVAVAGVEVGVLLPVSQAHPAELKLALAAGHVVAPAVLLDARVALGAVLCNIPTENSSEVSAQMSE
eukprot:131842-Pyramimonas_sp.AAC.1